MIYKALCKIYWLGSSLPVGCLSQFHGVLDLHGLRLLDQSVVSLGRTTLKRDWSLSKWLSLAWLPSSVSRLVASLWRMEKRVAFLMALSDPGFYPRSSSWLKRVDSSPISSCLRCLLPLNGCLLLLNGCLLHLHGQVLLLLSFMQFHKHFVGLKFVSLKNRGCNPPCFGYSKLLIIKIYLLLLKLKRLILY